MAAIFSLKLEAEFCSWVEKGICSILVDFSKSFVILESIFNVLVEKSGRGIVSSVFVNNFFGVKLIHIVQVDEKFR